MRICFVQPCSGRYPIGGHKIVYEYANRLAALGHDVHIIVLIVFPELVSLKRRFHAFGQYVRDRLTGGYLPHNWFKLDPRIVTSCYYSPAFARFPEADIVIATGWQTADPVARLGPKHGKKAYFIQGLETWAGHDDRVMSTWKLPLRKLMVAKWLGEIAEEMGETWSYVPNAIDHSFFRLTVPIEQRADNHILFCSHALSIKGTADVVQAINALRDEGLDLEVSAFGRVSPAKFGMRLPFDYFYDPPQTLLRDLYNQAAIYISPSHIEGWGLTPAEAAACGDALVASNMGGHRDYLKPGETAEMFEPKDVEALKNAIRKLVTSREDRCSLARRSHDAIQAYNWQDATTRFVETLDDISRD